MDDQGQQGVREFLVRTLGAIVQCRRKSNQILSPIGQVKGGLVGDGALEPEVAIENSSKASTDGGNGIRRERFVASRA